MFEELKRQLNWFFSSQQNEVETDQNPKLPIESETNPSKSKNLSGYPKTYLAFEKEEQSGEQLEVFDPALKHFPRAFRLSDPKFQDLEINRKWHETRIKVMDHLLSLICASSWKNQLVLRGSLLLKAWLGDAAREPGDIDWVFVPPNIDINNPVAQKLFDELIKLASNSPNLGNTRIDVAKITTDDIWTYERAAGRRIIFPWESDGLLQGVVQMDVVFSEEMLTTPIEIRLPLPGNHSVLAVSKELSLAWKLLWLENDSFPQGKDLYDATLLAEQTLLPRTLLQQVFQLNEDNSKAILNSNFPLEWNVDWENFRLEYPWVEGTAMDWQHRLALALAPTFSG